MVSLSFFFPLATQYQHTARFYSQLGTHILHTPAATVSAGLFHLFIYLAFKPFAPDANNLILSADSSIKMHPESKTIAFQEAEAQEVEGQWAEEFQGTEQPKESALKRQPWMAHWPPATVDTTAPYGYLEGQYMLINGQ